MIFLADKFHLDYSSCLRLLGQRLREPAPGRIQLLSGPRQVGKTTLLLALAKRLGGRALYVAADAPEAALPGFWERLWLRATEVARSRGKAVVLLDEVHLLPDWPQRLKSEWDRLRREGVPVHVVATGSSALRLGTGSRETLAGRFEKLTLTHWSPAALTHAFRIPRMAAVQHWIRLGGYPGAFELRHDLGRWTAYVRDSIVEAAIGRDVLALSPVRRPALLRQVFAACASAPAQVLSLQKIRGQLQDPGALETVAQYLQLLEEAFLVAPLEKYSPRPLRRRAAPPKLVVLSNALLAATDPRGIPSPEADPARFGAWVENACLAHAWNAGQRVTYWREEPLEVDGVLEGSWGRWAVEVKTGSFDAAALRGLLEFSRRFPEYRPLVLADGPARGVAARAGIASLSWEEFLWSGPPGAPPRRARKA
jgi:hypothetical protein